MPLPIVKKYADIYNVSLKKAEDEWKDSFNIAKDEYGKVTKRKSERNAKIYGTTTNVFKNKMKKKYSSRKDESDKIIYNSMGIMNFKKFNEELNNKCNIDLHIVAYDETSYWSDEIKEKIGKDGKILAYYLFDSSKHIHLAEITPSYELKWLYNRVETSSELSEDEIHEIEVNNGGSDEDVIYVHTNSEMGMIEDIDFGTDNDKKEACASDEEYNEYIDRVIEYYRSNPFEF